MLSDKLAFEEFKKIISIKTPAVFSSFRAEIIIPKKKPIIMTKFMFKRVIGDFTSNAADIIIVGCQIPPATYQDEILPHKDELQMRIQRSYKDDQGHDIKSIPTETTTYDAVLTDPLDLDALSMGDKNKFRLNWQNSGLFNITFQLVETTFSEIRLKDVSGIYPETTLQQLVKTLLTPELRNNASVDHLKRREYSGVRGVDIVPFNNQKKYSQVPIDSGTRISKLVNWLQDKKGLYGTDSNGYYQNGMWYVYPLFDTTRFAQSKNNLTVIVLSKDDGNSFEKTFIRKGSGKLTVLATGGAQVEDPSDKISLNQGDSLKFHRASDMDKMVVTSANKATGRPEKTTKALTIEKTKHGRQNVASAPTKFTDNPFKELSKIAPGKGQIIKVRWESADVKLLYPGMPVRVIFAGADKAVRSDGVLLGIDSLEAPGSGLLTDKHFVTLISLVIHVEKRRY